MSKLATIFSILTFFSGGLFIFFRRFFVSDRIILPFSETALFSFAVLTLSVTNAFGALFQFYLAQLVNWRGYNVHDLLLGGVDLRIDDFAVFCANLPQATMAAVVVLAVCHFQKKLLNFLALGTVGFFLSITVCDLYITFVLAPPAARPVVEDLLANALGAPLLAVLAAACYFPVARVVNSVASRVMRPLSIISLLSILLLFLTTFLFSFQRIFLITATTYLEADVELPERATFYLVPPQTSSAIPVDIRANFDVLASPHIVNGYIKTDVSDWTTVDWAAGKNDEPVSVQLFSVTECPAGSLEKFLSHFQAKDGREILVRSIAVSSRNTLLETYVPSEGGGVMLSANRDPRSASGIFSTVEFGDDDTKPLIEEMSVNDTTLLIRPIGQRLVVGLASEGGYPKGVAPDSTIKLNGEVFQISPSFNIAGRRCRAKAITMPSMKAVDATSGNLLLVVRPGQLGTGSGSFRNFQLRINARRAFISAGGIRPISIVDDNDLPIASGDLSQFGVDAKLSGLRMYGHPIDLTYSGWMSLRGERFHVSLGRNRKIKLHGSIASIDIDSERLMRTPWELMDPGLQIFILSGLVAALVYLGRLLIVFIARNEVADWLSWRF